MGVVCIRLPLGWLWRGRRWILRLALSALLDICKVGQGLLLHALKRMRGADVQDDRGEDRADHTDGEFLERAGLASCHVDAPCVDG
ncbi:hypothetical protein D9M70_532400 [compost metagenome]